MTNFKHSKRLKMSKSAFNIDQQDDLSYKITIGLERIAEAFKTLLWDHAKEVGLSPIQIQILIFIAYHKPSLSTVSYLAKEFNVTKPTISDAVKVLYKKELVIKSSSLQDSRSYTIALSNKCRKLLKNIDQFANPIVREIRKSDDDTLKQLYVTLQQLIYGLNKKGVLQVQRNCYGCSFYRRNDEGHYCNYLQKKLNGEDIRIDCPEYEPNN